jgi:hypothetical protein
VISFVSSLMLRVLCCLLSYPYNDSPRCLLHLCVAVTTCVPLITLTGEFVYSSSLHVPAGNLPRSHTVHAFSVQPALSIFFNKAEAGTSSRVISGRSRPDCLVVISSCTVSLHTCANGRLMSPHS